MKVSSMLKHVSLLFAAAMASGGAAGAETVVILDYPGAQLVIDDSGRSYGGVDTIMIDAGAHTLSLYLPAKNGRWMPPLIKRQFVSAELETLLINCEQALFLNINTTPEGASLFLNGRYLDSTPHSLTILRGVDKTVTVELEGYESETIGLGRETLERSFLEVPLKPAPATDGRKGSASPGEEIHGHIPRWVPYTALSYFVVSTALGFHSKSRADQLYEDYLGSSSRERMDSLYDQSRVMDNRARIYWITGQIALGASIYLFTREFRSHREERTRSALSFDMSRKNGGDFYLSLVYGDTGR